MKIDFLKNFKIMSKAVFIFSLFDTLVYFYFLNGMRAERIYQLGSILLGLQMTLSILILIYTAESLAGPLEKHIKKLRKMVFSLLAITFGCAAIYFYLTSDGSNRVAYIFGFISFAPDFAYVAVLTRLSLHIRGRSTS